MNTEYPYVYKGIYPVKADWVNKNKRATAGKYYICIYEVLIANQVMVIHKVSSKIICADYHSRYVN